MAPKRPVPGILLVNSDVLNPDKLSKKAFDDWYCEEHIPDVLKKSGISYAHRYEAISDGVNPPRKLNFLTIYGMPDINYMETEDFRKLEGQSPGPNQETIFKHAEFDTRSYELVQSDEAKDALSAPGPLLLFAAMSHNNDAKLDEWYRGEHVRTISECPGYRRTARYTNASRSILSAFERSFTVAPKWLALHEFEGTVLPLKELAATDETEWAKKLVPGLLDVDFGVFQLKRVYEKGQKTKL